MECADWMDAPDKPLPNRDGSDEASTGESPLAAETQLLVRSVYQPANFEYWSKMPFWKVLELGCVTLGYDPEPLLRATDEQLAEAEHKRQEIEARCLLAFRAVEMEYLGQQITPKDALAWLDAIQEDVPDELRRWIEAMPQFQRPKYLGEDKSFTDLFDRLERLEDLTGRANNTENKSDSTRIISNLRKMLLAMAHDKFGYDPDRVRNPAATNIQGALTKIELSLSVDAIRKHLDDAAEEHWAGPFK